MQGKKFTVHYDLWMGQLNFLNTLVRSVLVENKYLIFISNSILFQILLKVFCDLYSEYSTMLKIVEIQIF